MTHATAQPATESALWLPPGRMKQYAIARVVGGVLFATIFAGWMVIQWSNVTMRVAAGGLIVLTAWVTASSIMTDAKRMRGRQVAWGDSAIIVSTPAGETRVRMSEIARAVWRRNSEAFGMMFYDHRGAVLVRLDESFLSDESEARVFLRWLRTKTRTDFEVTWRS